METIKYMVLMNITLSWCMAAQAKTRSAFWLLIAIPGKSA